MMRYTKEFLLLPQSSLVFFSAEILRCDFLDNCLKLYVGFGPKFCGADGKPTESSPQTVDAAMPMETFFAKVGRKSRIKAEQPKRDLATFNTADLAAGAAIYQKDCAFCHGLPNQPKPDAAKGMFPHVPQLLDKEDMVTDDPVGESFWNVKNGIRLSGIPGFKESLSETQMWQVSALLAKADQLPPEVTARLQPKIVNTNMPVKQ